MTHTRISMTISIKTIIKTIFLKSILSSKTAQSQNPFANNQSEDLFSTTTSQPTQNIAENDPNLPTNAPITFPAAPEMHAVKTELEYNDFMLNKDGSLQLFLDPESGEKIYVVEKTGERISQQIVNAKFGITTPSPDQLSTRAPFVTNPFSKASEFFLDPRDLKWVLVNSTTKARVMPESVGVEAPTDKTQYASPQIWKNTDDNRPAFFYDEISTTYQYIDQISGMRFNATKDFYAESYTTLEQRKSDMNLRRENLLPRLKRDPCGKLQIFYDETSKIQVYLDIHIWAPVPIMSINEKPIFKPVFIEFYEWLALDINGAPEVVPEAGDCYYADSMTSQKYSLSRFVPKFLPIPIDFSKVKSVLEFSEYTGKLSLEISADLDKNNEGYPKQYTSINPDAPTKVYFKLKTSGEYVAVDKFSMDMWKLGLQSHHVAEKEEQLKLGLDEDSRVGMMKKEILPGSADDLIDKVPSLAPLASKNVVFFQLRDRVAAGYMQTLFKLLGSMNGFETFTFAKNSSAASNQDVLKQFVEAKRKDLEKMRGDDDADMKVRRYIALNRMNFST